MNADELRAAFPHHAKNIMQGPLPDCPECQGTGQKGETVCFCAYISEPDPEVRAITTSAFYNCIRRIIAKNKNP